MKDNFYRADRNIPVYERNDTNGIVYAEHKIIDHTVFKHCHDCCEIELIVEGSGEHIINGVSYPTRPGDVYFLTVHDYHEHRPTSPLSIYGVMFDENLCNDLLMEQILLLEAQEKLLITTLDGDERALVSTYFQNIVKENAQEVNTGLSKITISSLINCISAVIVRSIMGAGDIASNNKLVQEALIYAYQHFNEPISLSDVAKKVHVTEHHLARLLKKCTGYSCHEILQSLRLRYAKRLLKNTDLLITEIADFSGFSSYPYFSKKFKQVYGITAEKFRAQ